MQGGPSQPYAPPAQPKKGFPIWVIILLVVFGLGLLLVGTLGAIAYYGTQRYLGASKTAEAKSGVGAIARAARYAYEREHVDGTHKLCRSAIAVPSSVPRGVKYQPLASGGDFDSGDDETGWRCLKFAMSTPIYYQYHYNQGTGYLGKGASPGPSGFEAAARGDIDGDGTPSLFAITGSESGGTVTVTTSIYIEDELE